MKGLKINILEKIKMAKRKVVRVVKKMMKIGVRILRENK